MTQSSSTIARRPEAVSIGRSAAWAWGFAAVLGFSLSFPMTRVAVAQIDPVTVALGRAVVAGVLAAGWLALRRQKPPEPALWPRLAVVSLGVVIGFPLFSSIALREVPSGHAAVVVGLLPIATAIMAVLRAGERPSPAFWAAACLGLGCVLAFVVVRGAGAPTFADGLILLAVAFGALGYAEGGALARLLGGPSVISWALVLTLPILVPATAWRVAATGWPHAGAAAWAGFAYVALVSMWLGFFAWYRALALGGVARIGQIQLAQPVLTLLWSALLLGEAVTAGTIAAAMAVLCSVVLTQTMGRRG